MLIRPLEISLSRASLLGLGILITTLPACDGGGRRTESSAPRVPITVSNLQDAFSPVDSITLEQPDSARIVRLSGFDVSATGEFMLADASEANVKVFSQDGALIHILGRKGTGPGEFNAPRYPRFSGSSIFVAESDGRVAVFDTSGALVRSFRLDSISFVSGLEVLENHDLLVMVDWNGGAAVARFDSVGHNPRIVFALPRVSGPSNPDNPSWRHVTQYSFAVRADTAFVLCTLSDSLWTFSVVTGQGFARRLAIPGYIVPKLPETGTVNPRDAFSWMKTFHLATAPVEGEGPLILPFVMGVYMFGDPNLTLVRSGEGVWAAIQDAPPFVYAGKRLVYSLSAREDGSVILGRYRVVQH